MLLDDFTWSHFSIIFTVTHFKKGCSSSLLAVGLKDGSGQKHLSRKSFAISESVLGISGCCLYMPTLKIAASGAPNSVKGGFPVAISTTVQPRDQMSAYRRKNSLLFVMVCNITVTTTYSKSINTYYGGALQHYPTECCPVVPYMNAVLLFPIMNAVLLSPI